MRGSVGVTVEPAPVPERRRKKKRSKKRRSRLSDGAAHPSAPEADRIADHDQQRLHDLEVALTVPMHLLVYNESLRVAIVVPATATVLDVKEKVAKQTAKPNGTTDWPVDVQELLLRGDALADEMTLTECLVRDRDRIELARRAPEVPENARAASAALEPVLESISALAAQLEALERRVASAEAVHQEHFTQLLERLDGLSLDGLSDEERTFVRGQRKDLVRRTQDVSAAAARRG